jgi:hypothetical protein
MRPRVLAFAILALTWAGAAFARPPVVVELFTAQGCSSCGAASAYVAQLADQKDILALTYAVDYWDYLGWKDTFAKPEFTARQRAYAKALGVADIYTPQVVVNGHSQAPGGHPAEVDRLIRDARRDRVDPPDMKLRGDRVAIGSGRRPRGGAQVWLIRYDPRQQDVEVKDGDNRGHTVVERNVVAQAQDLGPWKGRPVLLSLPPAPQDGLRTVVLVQSVADGRTLGVLAPDEAKP